MRTYPRLLPLLVPAAVAAAALAAQAGAQPPATSTINMSYQVTSFPPGGPRNGGGWSTSGTGVGTFSSSGAINDSGALNLRFIQGALAAPTTGLLETERDLVGSKGTITLRCSEVAKDFSDLAAVPGNGSCAVTGGTGAYAALQGEGALTIVFDVLSGSSDDLLELKTP
jgi:hypothetical protein